MSKRVCKDDQIRLIMECRQSWLSDYQWCKDNGRPAVQGVLYCNKLFEYECTYKEKELSFKQIHNRRLKDQKP